MFDIVDKLVKINGMYEKVFGNELLNRLVYNQKKERYKLFLKNVYQYDDIDDIFEKEVLRDEFKTLSKIIFRFSESLADKK